MENLPRSIRTVFFDVGSTLIRPCPSMGEIYRRTLEPLGLTAPAREYERLFGTTWDELGGRIGRGADRFHAMPGGEMGYWAAYVGSVLDQLGSDADVESATLHLHDAFSARSAWEVFPDVNETLSALRGRGCQLGVISNWDSRLPVLLDSLGLGRFFTTVVFSSGAGAEKPSPLIFQEALRRAGARAEESVHVGDDLEADYAAAEAVGITGVLVDRDGSAPSTVRRVGDLSELLVLLEES